MRLFRRNRQCCHEQRKWVVEVEPNSWLVRYADTAAQARVSAFQLAPNGKGPWTVRSYEDHERTLT